MASARKAKLYDNYTEGLKQLRAAIESNIQRSEAQLMLDRAKLAAVEKELAQRGIDLDDAEDLEKKSLVEELEEFDDEEDES